LWNWVEEAGEVGCAVMTQMEIFDFARLGDWKCGGRMTGPNLSKD